MEWESEESVESVGLGIRELGEGEGEYENE